jgi:O-antigen/teichoic acid export membrane protein
VSEKRSAIYPSQFFRSSLIYAIGDLLTKGARIVLIPYYMACLSKQEIGQWSVLQAIIIATWTLLAFGFGAAIQRFYHDHDEDGDAFATSLWFARLGLSTLPAIIMAVAGYIYADQFSETLTVPLVMMAVAAGYFRASLNVTEQWFIIRQQPAAYRVFTFCQFLTTTLLTILFITGMGWGVAGAIGAELVSCLVWTIVSGCLLTRRARPRRNLIRWKEVFFYCLPALPHMFFMWGMSGVDRLILEQQVSSSDLGEYQIGYLLASVVSIGAMAMRSAWLPSFFKDTNTVTQRAQFGKTSTLFFYVVILSALCTFVFAEEIVSIFALASANRFDRAVDILRVVVAGNLGLSIFIGFNQPLFYERRIGVLASISGAGLLLNLLLNLILIPRIGIIGAAIATVVTYLAIAVSLMIVIRNLYQVRWEPGKLISFVGVACVIGMVSLWVSSGFGLLGMGLKSLLLLVYVITTLVEFKANAGGQGWSWHLRIEGLSGRLGRLQNMNRKA